MSEHPRITSYNIDRFSNALSQWTVDALCAADEEFERRYGADWRAWWLEDTLARLAYLSQAVAVESLPLFLDAVAGSRQAASADARLVADVRRSLEVLRDVLAREMPAGSVTLALSYLDAAVAQFDELEPRESVQRPNGPLAPVVLRYLEAALQGDDARAEDILERAVADGLSAPEVFERIVHPAQCEIGRMWGVGEVSIAEEHQATSIALTALARLLGKLPRGERRDRAVLVTTVEGELHDLGVRLVADLLRVDGWRVTCLGANVPVEDVVACARSQRFDVIALSVTSTLHVRACAETIDALRDAFDPEGPKILVAGRPFEIDDELWRRLGAHAHVGSALEAAERARRLCA